MLPAVVVIESSDSLGSGVIIDSKGVVVTNYHVVEGSSSISVVLANGDRFDDISVIDYDQAKDIVLLRIKGFDLPVAQLGNSNTVEVGDDVVVMGSPRGFEQSVTRGIVSAIRDSGDGYKLFQTDAAISPGSSGGGMFDAHGKLVGITVSYVENAQNINFVVPINYVRGILSLEPQYTLSEFLALQNDNSIASSYSSPASSDDSFNKFMEVFQKFADIELEYEPESGFWYVDNDGLTIAAFELNGVVYSVVYSVEQTEFSKEQLLEFLAMNYESNFGKIALDDDLLVVINEVPFSELTPENYLIILGSILELDSDLNSYLDNAASQQSLSPPNPVSRGGNKPAISENATIRLYPLKSFGDEKFQLRVDPNRWDLISENEGDATYSSTNSFIKIILESSEFSYEYMLDAVLLNLQAIDPNARIIASGFRSVNDKELAWLEMEAEVSDASIKFLYHIYTGTEGSVQVIGWSAANVYESQIPLFEEVAASLIVSP